MMQRSLLFLLVSCALSTAGAFSSLSWTAPSRTIHKATNAAVDVPLEAPPPQQQQPTESSSVAAITEQCRVLGSQENLMLPRQYAPGPDVFPSMNHVSVVVLSSTPSERYLRRAIDNALAAHPLLRCYIRGDGEPDERIDLFQMVRKGDPRPCTFVSDGPPHETPYSAQDVLQVVNVLTPDRECLEASWKTTFQQDLDDGSWCRPATGPLWKLEWHCHQANATGLPCALVFSFNHAISDQSSANRLMHQIVTDLAMMEEDDNDRLTNPTVVQNMPVSVEDSVLGINQRWNDVWWKGISPGTLAYILGKAAEGFKAPVILPDSRKDGSSLWSSLSIIAGQAAGGEDETVRKSTLAFRSLSASTMTNLLVQCRSRQVSVTNALTAAMTLTSTDFIDGGSTSGSSSEASLKRRNYKILESLDLRRYGAQLDRGETVGCLAGSMDLLHGPFPDRSGEALRQSPTREKVEDFWMLAQSGRDQTNAFIDSEGPKHAMRVFDFAMTIADLNNLVYLTAQSKDSQGRAYSAGVTNNGVLEGQEAFRRQGDEERPRMQTTHGRYTMEDIYYGVSHARSGCLYQMSCLTLGGEMKLTFHPAMPLVSEETNAQFADAFVELMEVVSSPPPA